MLYLRTTAARYLYRYLYETGHIEFPHFCRMTYSYHQIDHFCHPQLDFLLENDDDVWSHLESHFCANDGDRLTEKIDDMISQVSGADFFYREIGGDQNLYSTVSGVVTCHENMSLKTEIEIYTADLHHYRLISEMFPLNVVGARYLVCCRMTTGQAQLFRLSLTAGIALLRLLKMAARHYGSSLKPEDALHVGWRLRLR